MPMKGKKLDKATTEHSNASKINQNQLFYAASSKKMTPIH
jgi:hypothetical protein